MPRAKESSAEITIAEKMTRVIENRSDAASAEGCGEFRPVLSSRHIRGYRSFRRNGRPVRYEFANCRRGRRRRCRRENKICQITEPAGSRRTLCKSRRWPWVAYCNSNLFVLSFRKNEKEAQRANPFPLIAWLSVANVDHVCATDFWYQIQNPLVIAHSRNINLLKLYTLGRISTNIWILDRQNKFWQSV